MSFDPGRARIESVVRAALSAPTGDNCQPFFFRWTRERALEIRHREKLGRHGLNPENHASLLTLGCVLELATLRASALGLRAEFEASPDLGSQPRQGEADAFWGALRFSECPPSAPAYATAIEARACDRRPYQGGSLNDSALLELRNLNPDLSRVALHLIPPPRGVLLGFFLKSEEYLWRHEPTRRDLLSWVRFARGERDSTRDGLYWKNLGVGVSDALFLRLFRRFPSLLRLIWPFFRIGLHGVLKRQLSSSAGLVLLSLNETSAMALVEAGRAGVRSWLLLNHSGYGVQPLSLATLNVYDSAAGTLPAFASEAFRAHFETGLGVWREALSLRAPWVPVWALRFGKAAALPEPLRALRRELSGHLEIEA